MARLVRNSERTYKCKRCGQRPRIDRDGKAYYWYHLIPDGKDPESCDNRDDCRKFLLVEDAAGLIMDPDGLVMAHRPPYCRDEYVRITGSDSPPPPKEEKPKEEEPKPQAKDTGPHDHEDIRAIAQKALATVESLNIPTRVTVSFTGETREFEGLTHEAFPNVLRLLGIGMEDDDPRDPVNIWMVGPAGTGKSTIARQAAEALDVPYSDVSLSPDMSTFDITGYMNAHGTYVRSPFRDAYEHGHVFLFDEVDNGHPSILAKMNMALSQPSMSFPDGRVNRHPAFRCLAAANTFGDGPDRMFVGRQQLDFATLDRFITVRISVDENVETTVAMAQGADEDDTYRLLNYVRTLRKAAQEHNLPWDCTPRASIDGAKMLAQGFAWKDVVDMRIRKGLSDTDWKRVSGGAMP